MKKVCYCIINVLIESWELPAAWLVATTLTFVWEDRAAGKSTGLSRLRAELKDKLALLGSTKWKHYSLHNSVVLFNEAKHLLLYVCMLK